MRRSRRGFSLLEMLAATALVAGALTPTLAAIRDAMAVSREANQRELLANYAVRVLESQIALQGQTWSGGTTTGSFAADGRPDVRFTADCSDAVVDGGAVDRLMHIQITAYYDQDGDDAQDAGELQVGFRTKIAKLSSYESEEN